MKMKTPQEVFKLMLEHWDEFNTYQDGICVKLVGMTFWGHDKISWGEYNLVKKFMWNHRQIAAKNYKAKKDDEEDYWWCPSNQEIRKKFVKYLSEQP